MKDSPPMIRRPLTDISKCTSALFLVQLKRKKSRIELLTKALALYLIDRQNSRKIFKSKMMPSKRYQTYKFESKGVQLSNLLLS